MLSCLAPFQKNVTDKSTRTWNLHLKNAIFSMLRIDLVGFKYFWINFNRDIKCTYFEGFFKLKNVF